MGPPCFSVVTCVGYERKTTELQIETGDGIEPALKILLEYSLL